MLAVAAFIKTVHLAKYVMFAVENGAHTLNVSNSAQFAPIINEIEGCLLQLVILNAIIV